MQSQSPNVAGPAEAAAVKVLHDLLAGAWAACAAQAAAELGIPDAIGDGHLTASEIAGQVRADSAYVAGLLDFLATRGVVARIAGTYALTDVGRLLRDGSPFRDLALLGTGECYQAWGRLADVVRAGVSAFQLTYGIDYFSYMTEHRTGELFLRAMNAVAEMVGPLVADAFAFAPHSTVADIGAGKGLVLKAILAAHPTVRGIVFDQAPVVTSAVTDEDKEKFGNRLTVVPGDFFTAVPGGCDVYILGRVLHDWTDARCLRILQTVRAACHPASCLLILERLLPEFPSPGDSTTFGLNMNMMVVTGGRERTLPEYTGLLAATGFEVGEVRDLRADMKLLVARLAR